MNTHLVVLDDIMLGSSVTQSCFLPFPVAASTEFRDITRKYGGFDIRLGHYAMLTMTIRTDRCILVILRGQNSMGTFAIPVHYLGMADGTIHFAGILADGVVLMINIYMALGTGDTLLLMNRMLEIIDINKQAPLISVGQNLLKIWIGMTFQAELVVQAVFIKNSPGLMRSMTFNTGRYFMRFCFPQLPTDDLGMRFFNICMTFHAGFHHIQAADRRFRVRVGQNIMRGMAAGTYRCNGQTLAKKTLTVDGHGKIFQDIMFTNIMGQGHGAAFLVAAAAGKRNI